MKNKWFNKHFVNALYKYSDYSYSKIFENLNFWVVIKNLFDNTYAGVLSPAHNFWEKEVFDEMKETNPTIQHNPEVYERAISDFLKICREKLACVARTSTSDSFR